MQTEIVLREKLETLKRLDDMILDFLLPHPRPSPCFLAVDRPPWYKFISLPSLSLPLKSKMAVIIFVMKLLSTRSPKLGLLCRLKMEKK